MNNSNLQRLKLQKPLLKFRTCIEQCFEFITKFTDEASWFFKVFNQNFNHEFEELNI
jgi:hypothetical protein